ncbi:MAG TPA: hypothetical protein PLF40_02530 [Kofleriaceae bacterium]|nr:hypothetical protein [Kofleriaceae bacterium]
MKNTVIVSFVMFAALVAGCKKDAAKGEAAPAGKAEPAKNEPAKTEPAKTEPPKASEFAIAPLAATGVAECDGINEKLTKYNACAKLTDEVRVVMKTNVEQLPGVVKALTDAPADQKDMAKGMVVKFCKDTSEQLDKQLKDSGC